MRIAIVKSSDSNETYACICDIEDVEEYDVVQVSGCETPLMVYEVEDDNLRPGIRYPHVLRKLEENNNVTVTTRYMNITNSECDCIVNSLCPDTSVFTPICKSIYKKASDEIDYLIDNYPHGEIFDYFVTPAGKLKAKNIIHIIMPFKKHDIDNRDLRNAFVTVIDKAIAIGMKSIAIPCIGTGVNGYTKKDIYDALDDVVFRYMYTSDIEIDIEIVINGISSKNQGMRYIFGMRSDSRICYDMMPGPVSYKPCISFKWHDMQENIRQIIDLIDRRYEEKDELDIMEDSKLFYYKTAYSFIDNYIHALYNKTFRTYKEIKVGLKKYYHRKNDFSEFRNGRALSKKDVFNMSVAMGLNFTMFIQFMTLAGYTFSPIRDENCECVDLMVLKYAYENDGFIEGVNDFIEYVNTSTKNKRIINYLCPVSKKAEETI